MILLHVEDYPLKAQHMYNDHINQEQEEVMANDEYHDDSNSPDSKHGVAGNKVHRRGRCDKIQ